LRSPHSSQNIAIVHLRSAVSELRGLKRENRNADSVRERHLHRQSRFREASKGNREEMMSKNDGTTVGEHNGFLPGAE
jgi:hypothetical protein